MFLRVVALASATGLFVLCACAPAEDLFGYASGPGGASASAGPAGPGGTGPGSTGSTGTSSGAGGSSTVGSGGAATTSTGSTSTGSTSTGSTSTGAGGDGGAGATSSASTTSSSTGSGEVGTACESGSACASGFCACETCATEAGLFISEYIEGTVSNKAIELFNPTEEAIDLAAEGCEIRTYANGAFDPTSTEVVEGTIDPGETRSVCAIGSVFGLSCGQLTLNLSFNGNDAVELACGGVALDVIGRIGEDPGTEWGTGDASTADNTLRRLPGVVKGDPDGSDAFDPSLEWTGWPNNDRDDLNDHTPCP